MCLVQSAKFLVLYKIQIIFSDKTVTFFLSVIKCEISIALILNNELVPSRRVHVRGPTIRGNSSRAALRETKGRDIDVERRIHPSPSATDVRRKKARKKKKGESIIKLAFYSAGEQIERRARGTGEGEGAEYKVTSHVYFIPVDPIKVPIIISDVFRCNMFDLVSDILWSHICLVNLAAVAPLHKNIKRRCVPRSTPSPRR